MQYLIITAIDKRQIFVIIIALINEKEKHLWHL